MPTESTTRKSGNFILLGLAVAIIFLSTTGDWVVGCTVTRSTERFPLAASFILATGCCSFSVPLFQNRYLYIGMLTSNMEMTASIRLFIILRNNPFALVNCDDELCGSIPSFSAISLCEKPSMTAILNTLQYPEGNLSISSKSSFSSNLESEV